MARSSRRAVVAATGSMAALALLIPTMAAGSAGRSAGDPVDAAIRHVQENARDLGVARSDVADLAVSSSYRSSHTRVTHVNLSQRTSGLEVFGGHVTVNVAADGSVLFVGDSLVSGVSDTSGSAGTDAIAAVEAAADALELHDPGRLRIIREGSGPARRTTVSGGDISDRAIPARLGYQPADDGLRLAWQLLIDDSSDSHLWNATVDAETGDLLAVDDWTDHDTREGLASGLMRSGAETSAAAAILSSGATVFQPANPVQDGSSYRIYPQESPDDGDRVLLPNPADGTASPFGWHDVSGTPGAEFTITRGNNVHAYTDRDASNDADPGSEPDGGPGLSFDFPIHLDEHPQTYMSMRP
jgi:extracellular elastinolytic metalloproteinase